MFRAIGKVFDATSNVLCGTAETAEDLVDLVQDELDEIGQDLRSGHVADRRARSKLLIGGKATKSELYYVSTPRRFRKLQHLSA